MRPAAFGPSSLCTFLYTNSSLFVAKFLSFFVKRFEYQIYLVDSALHKLVTITIEKVILVRQIPIPFCYLSTWGVKIVPFSILIASLNLIGITNLLLNFFKDTEFWQILFIEEKFSTDNKVTEKCYSTIPSIRY